EGKEELALHAVGGTLGQYADDRVGPAVDAEGTAHDLGIRPELLRPEAVGQDHDVVLPDLALLREEVAPVGDPQPVVGDPSRRAHGTQDLLRAASEKEAGGSARPRMQPREHA